jgi:hypothetical protein
MPVATSISIRFQQAIERNEPKGRGFIIERVHGQFRKSLIPAIILLGDPVNPGNPVNSRIVRPLHLRADERKHGRNHPRSRKSLSSVAAGTSASWGVRFMC